MIDPFTLYILGGWVFGVAFVILTKDSEEDDTTPHSPLRAPSFPVV